MVKETIKYIGFDDQEREEDFYFNLNKTELMEAELSVPGGLSVAFEKAMKAKNVAAVVFMFRDLLWRAYGEKTADGRGFHKSPQLTQAFVETPAYDKLFMELVTSEDKARVFLDNLMPKDLLAEAKKNAPATLQAL